MSSPDWVTLRRDCVATTVPAGQWTLLRGGTPVQVAQRAGASITVRTGDGSLLRLDADDADAVGLEPPPAAAEAADGSFDMARGWEALAQVFDPEIPVSIVELGLVYRCDDIPLPFGMRRIEVDLSMTAPGCGMGDVLRGDAERALLAVPGVDEVEVLLVWDPPWTLDRMSDEARLQLGLL
jgi:probable FeS assembly SUF system protein SufT